MSQNDQDRINSARVFLDKATANVAAYVARRDLNGDVGNVPAAEVQQLCKEIEACRLMLDLMVHVAREVTNG